ncbi:MAG: hypothetical protein AAF182_04530 [Pseudomonadota bacterium]
MTLLTSFQSGVVTGRDERPIPVVDTISPSYQTAQYQRPFMQKMSRLTRALYTAMEGRISVVESASDDADSIQVILNSNPNVTIQVTQAMDLGEARVTAHIGDSTTDLRLHRESDIEEQFVRLIGRICPDQKENGLIAIRAVTEARKQAHTRDGNGQDGATFIVIL